MGCSNPHPHGQIWTTTGTPEEPAQELEQQQKYARENNGRSLLADYVKVELEKKERIVFQNASFLVVCPWWAVWPFEVMIISKEHKRSLVDLNESEQLDFAEAVAEVTRRYDNLFETSFPYSELRLFIRSSPPLQQEMLGANRRSRLRHSSSSSLRHRRRDQQLAPSHALLPTPSSQRNCQKIPGWV